MAYLEIRHHAFQRSRGGSAPLRANNLAHAECRAISADAAHRAVIADWNSDPHYLIVAHEVTNVGSDRGQLCNMSERARVAIGSEAIEAVADRGFGTKQCDELSATHGLAFGLPLLLGIRSRRTAELCAKTAKGSRLRIRWCHRHTHEDVVGFRPDVVEAAFVLDNVPDSRKVVERPFLVGPEADTTPA